MKLVHSYHYFENKVKLDQNKIIDTGSNSVIQVLSNFYRDKTVFNVKIERVLNKKRVFKIINGSLEIKILIVIFVIIPKDSD